MSLEEVPVPEPEIAPESEPVDAVATAPEAETPPTPIPVEFVNVVMALPSTHPILVLREIAAPYREIRIPIGLPEGTAIAFAAQQVSSPRPLTHDLFTEALTKLGQTIEVVRITALAKSTYLAELVLSGPTGAVLLECRPSDGVALALRHRPPPPITVASDVLQAMGITSA
jgi:uncharacterized protein